MTLGQRPLPIHIPGQRMVQKRPSDGSSHRFFVPLPKCRPSPWEQTPLAFECPNYKGGKWRNKIMYVIVSWNSSGSGFTRQAFPPLKHVRFPLATPGTEACDARAARSGRSGGSCQRSCYVCHFSVARNRCRIDAKHGDHFLQADMNVTYRIFRSGLLSR